MYPTNRDLDIIRRNYIIKFRNLDLCSSGCDQLEKNINFMISVLKNDNDKPSLKQLFGLFLVNWFEIRIAREEVSVTSHIIGLGSDMLNIFADVDHINYRISRLNHNFSYQNQSMANSYYSVQTSQQHTIKSLQEINKILNQKNEDLKDIIQRLNNNEEKRLEYEFEKQLQLIQSHQDQQVVTNNKNKGFISKIKDFWNLIFRLFW
ncbi:hypothetical protein DLAC_08934 [Tieghemostelium lacteum]|uniref:Uncharacterized protein n=1 Tax=Tieghemostelium lacteum TaxID=361077 RepID=A0A151Z8N7_TIELA|nr:hypothetical protein DLAC_08934 [Tieghemostelium lacteum]|eukprot:KYQ90329.1 hypothetical protein DLAC_08934 [Tieghemostelium lacteum]